MSSADSEYLWKLRLSFTHRSALKKVTSNSLLKSKILFSITVSILINYFYTNKFYFYRLSQVEIALYVTIVGFHMVTI